jgi:predicted TIM-barrel fold metal-dependent hydrolase
VRVWGEHAELLSGAGADVAALALLERRLAAQVEDLPRAGSLDAHVHLGHDVDGHHLAAEDLLADLRGWGIERAICFPANESGADGLFGAANREVLEAAGRSAGRIVPFCRVDPTATGAREALAVAAAAGARGLKLHPVAQRFRPEAPDVSALVADATALGWPVTIHAGYGARALEGPIAALVEAVPGARIILAHAGRGDSRALARRLDSWPDVMLDTSLAALSDLVELPPERLCFGSDRPYGEHATALLLVRAAARIAAWNPEQVAGVMGGNLRRWID